MESEPINPSNLALAVANKHVHKMGMAFVLAADIETALFQYAEFIAAPRWGRCERCDIYHDWPNKGEGKTVACVRQGAKAPTPLPEEKP